MLKYSTYILEFCGALMNIRTYVSMYFSIRAGKEQERRARCGDCRRWKPHQCLLTGNPLFGTVWTGLQCPLTLLVFIKLFYKAYISPIT